MLHYHGTPITPAAVMAQLAGRCFCVSYATYKRGKDVDKHAHEIGQSVMLDNGAFTFWKSGTPTNWAGFVQWARPWLDYRTTWAVMPDVIDGGEDDNDRLIAWLFNHDREVWKRCAPVWHMHESIDRLQRLCHGYERVCIGSSGQYAAIGEDRWHRRMEQAMNAVCGNGAPGTWLHMLRGMALSGSQYPFASVDSTDIAQNHARPQNTAPAMATRWDAKQNPARWVVREQLELVA